MELETYLEELGRRADVLRAAGELVACPLCPAGALVVPGTTCPRSIECPDCGAGAGSSCRRPSDHRADVLHAARVRAAELEDCRRGAGLESAAAAELETCARCGAVTIGAPCSCTAPAERHEVARLFEPAPVQLEGQGWLEL